MLSPEGDGHARGRRDTGLELAPHTAGDRPLGSNGYGSGQSQALVARKQLGVPPAPDDREAVVHEEAIACGGGRVATGSVEHPEDELVAAIVDVVEQRPVPSGGVLRGEDHEVGLTLDQPPRVARGEREIDDGAIRRESGVEREMGGAREQFVRPRLAERFSFGERRPGGDLEADEFRLSEARTRPARPDQPEQTPG